MKFPKVGKKNYVLVGAIVVALAFFAWTIFRQREGFTDPGAWTVDPESTVRLQTVSITEDGTQWATTPDTNIWRKLKGASWVQVKGNAKQIDGQNSTIAVCVGVDNGLYQTNDGGQTWNTMGGGQGQWISMGDDGQVLAVGTDSKVYEWNGSEGWKIPPFQGMATQVSVGQRGVAQVIGGGIIQDLVNGQWQNTGAPSTHVDIAKNGLSVEVSTDGNVYYKMPGEPQKKFEGSTIRQLSASTTMLAAITTDGRAWTKSIAGAPAAAPAAPAGPSPSSAPGLSAGSQSASCSQCTVVNGQISCACDVLPKA